MTDAPDTQGDETSQQPTQQPEQPAEGGSYTRDPFTGALTRNPEQE